MCYLRALPNLKTNKDYFSIPSAISQPIHLDLVIFARFKFLRISPGGKIREFKSLTKNIIIVPPIIDIDNSQILDFTKSLKIINSQKSKQEKMTRSTVYILKFDGSDVIMTLDITVFTLASSKDSVWYLLWDGFTDHCVFISFR